MPHHFDLLVLGDVNPDVILGPLTGDLDFRQRENLVGHGALTLGGSAAITAAGAARLGLKVAFAGRIGDDAAGRFVRDILGDRDVDARALTVDPILPTPLTAILTRDDRRAIITSSGVLGAVTAADVPAHLLAGARHVHASSYFLMPALAAGLPELFRTARAHGATTSLDTNDDPARQWDPTGIPLVLQETDFLLPNAAEARQLSGKSALSDAAAHLAALGPTVVIKNGADGAIAHHRGETVTVPASPVTPLDTVGAGDSFNAAFLAATLRGLPLPDALRAGVAGGGRSTLARGGIDGQPTWDDLLDDLHLTETESA
ncbi:sugar kinase [Amycolatopsis rhizosphaerae]|uniref:Sugar kinase n=1 Tax=Amycolatopsis rhizosphaerae TaxID=2053003 RepID=A0A558BR19_9PSEU|nr:sugar kinase [Amycolatopsis rhizosphaerae]TVT38948.1 sugar kinase [Amycolatopsis rhizosphaerae]